MSSDYIELPGEPPSGVLTLRMIISGKFIGYLIGKGGETIKLLRKESGAKIIINTGSSLKKGFVKDESCPKRIVAVTGTIGEIYKSYTMICRLLDEKRQLREDPDKKPLSLEFVLPSCQCGALIGKKGCKIKEIREKTGAKVFVDSDVLPLSTERCVKVTGSREEVLECTYEILCTLLENPTKESNIEYDPEKDYNEAYLSKRNEDDRKGRKYKDNCWKLVRADRNEDELKDSGALRALSMIQKLSRLCQVLNDDESNSRKVFIYIK